MLSTQVNGESVFLTTRRRTLRADAFVNCCGAWASSLDASLGVVPRKGQMLVIAQPEHVPLTRVLRSPEIYLIPRDDKKIVIGATVEDAGYSRSVEPEALDLLRRRAAPCGIQLRLLRKWIAGLVCGRARSIPCRRLAAAKTTICNLLRPATFAMASCSRREPRMELQTSFAAECRRSILRHLPRIARLCLQQ